MPLSALELHDLRYSVEKWIQKTCTFRKYVHEYVLLTFALRHWEYGVIQYARTHAITPSHYQVHLEDYLCMAAYGSITIINMYLSKFESRYLSTPISHKSLG